MQDALFGWFGQAHRARARSGPGPAGLPRPRPSAAAAVDDQAVHRVGRAIEGRTDRRQGAERLPLLIGVEEHLKQHAIAVLMPSPLDRAVRQRRLGQVVLIGVFPATSWQLTCVEDFDRPPLGHVYATAIRLRSSPLLKIVRLWAACR